MLNKSQRSTRRERDSREEQQKRLSLEINREQLLLQGRKGCARKRNVSDFRNDECLPEFRAQ